MTGTLFCETGISDPDSITIHTSPIHYPSIKQMQPLHDAIILSCLQFTDGTNYSRREDPVARQWP
jgi:hypothetical protein